VEECKNRSHFQQWLREDASERFFIVKFKTGAVVVVSPKPDNPLEYSFRIHEEQDRGFYFSGCCLQQPRNQQD
jgi:hypothetical protein